MLGQEPGVIDTRQEKPCRWRHVTTAGLYKAVLLSVFCRMLAAIEQRYLKVTKGICRTGHRVRQHYYNSWIF